MARPTAITLLTITIFALMSVALAEPVGDGGYPPIPAAASGAASIVVVERGDHLWKISDEALSTQLGRAAGDEEVRPFWREVIEANRNRIKSGDPDLIFPGEEIVIPGS